MDINLSKLEKHMLLKCNKRPLARDKMSVAYARHPIEEREKALNHLKEQQYIFERNLPNLGSRRLVLFYEITDKGKAWVKKNTAG